MFVAAVGGVNVCWPGGVRVSLRTEMSKEVPVRGMWGIRK